MSTCARAEAKLEKYIATNGGDISKLSDIASECQEFWNQVIFSKPPKTSVLPRLRAFLQNCNHKQNAPSSYITSMLLTANNKLQTSSSRQSSNFSKNYTELLTQDPELRMFLLKRCVEHTKLHGSCEPNFYQKILALPNDSTDADLLKDAYSDAYRDHYEKALTNDKELQYTYAASTKVLLWHFGGDPPFQQILDLVPLMLEYNVHYLDKLLEKAFFGQNNPPESNLECEPASDLGNKICAQLPYYGGLLATDSDIQDIQKRRRNFNELLYHRQFAITVLPQRKLRDAELEAKVNHNVFSSVLGQCVKRNNADMVDVLTEFCLKKHKKNIDQLMTVFQIDHEKDTASDFTSPHSLLSYASWMGYRDVATHLMKFMCEVWALKMNSMLEEYAKLGNDLVYKEYMLRVYSKCCQAVPHTPLSILSSAPDMQNVFEKRLEGGSYTLDNATCDLVQHIHADDRKRVSRPKDAIVSWAKRRLKIDYVKTPKSDVPAVYYDGVRPLPDYLENLTRLLVRILKDHKIPTDILPRIWTRLAQKFPGRRRDINIGDADIVLHELFIAYCEAQHHSNSLERFKHHYARITGQFPSQRGTDGVLVVRDAVSGRDTAIREALCKLNTESMYGQKHLIEHSSKSNLVTKSTTIMDEYFKSLSDHTSPEEATNPESTSAGRNEKTLHLLELATGGGKSYVIQEAVKQAVLLAKQHSHYGRVEVDVVTSSRLLAQRDAVGIRAFLLKKPEQKSLGRDPESPLTEQTLSQSDDFVVVSMCDGASATSCNMDVSDPNLQSKLIAQLSEMTKQCSGDDVMLCLKLGESPNVSQTIVFKCLRKLSSKSNYDKKFSIVLYVHGAALDSSLVKGIKHHFPKSSGDLFSIDSSQSYDDSSKSFPTIVRVGDPTSFMFDRLKYPIPEFEFSRNLQNAANSTSTSASISLPNSASRKVHRICIADEVDYALLDCTKRNFCLSTASNDVVTLSVLEQFLRDYNTQPPKPTDVVRDVLATLLVQKYFIDPSTQQSYPYPVSIQDAHKHIERSFKIADQLMHNVHYIIDNVHILIIDDTNYGILPVNVVWNNLVHQIIQLRHGLPLTVPPLYEVRATMPSLVNTYNVFLGLSATLDTANAYDKVYTKWKAEIFRPRAEENVTTPEHARTIAPDGAVNTSTTSPAAPPVAGSAASSGTPYPRSYAGVVAGTTSAPTGSSSAPITSTKASVFFGYKKRRSAHKNPAINGTMRASHPLASTPGGSASALAHGSSMPSIKHSVARAGDKKGSVTPEAAASSVTPYPRSYVDVVAGTTSAPTGSTVAMYSPSDQVLLSLVKEVAKLFGDNKPRAVLIICQTPLIALKVYEELQKNVETTATPYSEVTLFDRESPDITETFRAFVALPRQVIVATPIAGRGVHIDPRAVDTPFGVEPAGAGLDVIITFSAPDRLNKQFEGRTRRLAETGQRIYFPLNVPSPTYVVSTTCVVHDGTSQSSGNTVSITTNTTDVNQHKGKGEGIKLKSSLINDKRDPWYELEFDGPNGCVEINNRINHLVKRLGKESKFLSCSFALQPLLEALKDKALLNDFNSEVKLSTNASPPPFMTLIQLILQKKRELISNNDQIFPIVIRFMYFSLHARDIALHIEEAKALRRDWLGIASCDEILRIHEFSTYVNDSVMLYAMKQGEKCGQNNVCKYEYADLPIVLFDVMRWEATEMCYGTAAIKGGNKIPLHHPSDEDNDKNNEVMIMEAVNRAFHETRAHPMVTSYRTAPRIYDKYVKVFSSCYEMMLTSPGQSSPDKRGNLRKFYEGMRKKGMCSAKITLPVPTLLDDYCAKIKCYIGNCVSVPLDDIRVTDKNLRAYP